MRPPMRGERMLRGQSGCRRAGLSGFAAAAFTLSLSLTRLGSAFTVSSARGALRVEIDRRSIGGSHARHAPAASSPTFASSPAVRSGTFPSAFSSLVSGVVLVCAAMARSSRTRTALRSRRMSMASVRLCAFGQNIPSTVSLPAVPARIGGTSTARQRVQPFPPVGPTPCVRMQGTTLLSDLGTSSFGVGPTAATSRDEPSSARAHRSRIVGGQRFARPRRSPTRSASTARHAFQKHVGAKLRIRHDDRQALPASYDASRLNNRIQIGLRSCRRWSQRDRESKTPSVCKSTTMGSFLRVDAKYLWKDIIT
mmetsp:Transcript_36792/g.101185  ORF Transcript_36792/g.101185 Transcript_36792/m.101185 type:complete len:310 (+) Transcript_36792:78-1007(+)